MGTLSGFGLGAAFGLIVHIVEHCIRIGRHIPVVQKRVFLQSDIHERGLQVVLEILNAPLEDTADKAFLFRVLHDEFLKATVFGDGHPGLQFFDVYDDLAPHF